MGRAARWLRGILGIKKLDSGSNSNSNSNSNGGSASDSNPKKEEKKKRWGFAIYFKEKEKGKLEERKGWFRDVAPRGIGYADGVDQSNREIAAAARAAAEREDRAAVRIQAAFRGYLARRALKALRGLVKLQALARGNIVRKQAAETLRCMEALVRVQSKARVFRALRSASTRSNILSAAAARQRTSLDQWWMDDEKNANILGVDPGKPEFINYSTGRSKHLHSSFSTLVNSPSLRRRRRRMSPLISPSESACFGIYFDHPSYMADTESSRARLRSQSAPRLRPESKRLSSLHDRFGYHGVLL